MHGNRKLLVPVDVLRAQEPLEISFQVKDARSPVQLKWSESDTRMLGFRLTRFRMDPIRAASYRLGDVIDFTAGGNAAEYLGLQWGEADGYGCWTIGPSAP